MGWKSFKEHFKIEHIVQVKDAGICIGSGYVSELVTVNVATGVVMENSTFSGFLSKHYPALLSASAEEILHLINAEDSFSASVPVYTYDGGKIVEKLCEQPGYPHVTHDGHLMYENTYSTDKDQVVRWAKRNAEAGITSFIRCIERTQKELAEQTAELEACKRDLAELNAAYSDLNSNA
jgi:hypothetical protein